MRSDFHTNSLNSYSTKLKENNERSFTSTCPQINLCLLSYKRFSSMISQHNKKLCVCKVLQKRLYLCDNFISGMVMAENFVNGASRLWCRCKYESGSYRHLHTHLWNDPGPSIHLLFHVFSPYRMDRTTGTQNAVTPFNCDVNDQTESNSIFTEKLIFFIFFHRKNCCSLLSLTVFQRQMMYKFLHHCEG